ncbi:GNAT family N-acetyltransferase [Candidatus Shapirobacteria bacterium]|nr:GNAT family N-acetyltransferase [Candidatus Shapirobacteria bacterium]
MSLHAEISTGRCPEKAEVLLSRAFGEKYVSQPTQENFCLCLNGELAGVAVNRLYLASEIGKQLFLSQEGELFYLTKFQDMIKNHGFLLNNKVIEIAYITIDPEHRNRGYAKGLFSKGLEDLRTKYPGETVIVMPKGPFAGKGLASQITKLMLEVEKNKNGSTNGLVNVNGERVSRTYLENILGLKLDAYTPYSGNQIITHLASTNGFSPVGYYRNLSPVWVKQI